jgi:hypothetical protein
MVITYKLIMKQKTKKPKYMGFTFFKIDFKFYDSKQKEISFKLF